jgi:hypothetical protein
MQRMRASRHVSHNLGAIGEWLAPLMVVLSCDEGSSKHSGLLHCAVGCAHLPLCSVFSRHS